MPSAATRITVDSSPNPHSRSPAFNCRTGTLRPTYGPAPSAVTRIAVDSSPNPQSHSPAVNRQTGPCVLCTGRLHRYRLGFRSTHHRTSRVAYRRPTVMPAPCVSRTGRRHRQRLGLRSIHHRILRVTRRQSAVRPAPCVLRTGRTSEWHRISRASATPSRNLQVQQSCQAPYSNLKVRAQPQHHLAPTPFPRCSKHCDRLTSVVRRVGYWPVRCAVAVTVPSRCERNTTLF